MYKHIIIFLPNLTNLPLLSCFISLHYPLGFILSRFHPPPRNLQDLLIAQLNYLITICFTHVFSPSSLDHKHDPPPSQGYILHRAESIFCHFFLFIIYLWQNPKSWAVKSSAFLLTWLGRDLFRLSNVMSSAISLVFTSSSLGSPDRISCSTEDQGRLKLEMLISKRISSENVPSITWMPNITTYHCSEKIKQNHTMGF